MQACGACAAGPSQTKPEPTTHDRMPKQARDVWVCWVVGLHWAHLALAVGEGSRDPRVHKSGRYQEIEQSRAQAAGILGYHWHDVRLHCHRTLQHATPKGVWWLSRGSMAHAVRASLTPLPESGGWHTICFRGMRELKKSREQGELAIDGPWPADHAVIHGSMSPVCAKRINRGQAGWRWREDGQQSPC